MSGAGPALACRALARRSRRLAAVARQSRRGIFRAPRGQGAPAPLVEPVPAAEAALEEKVAACDSAADILRLFRGLPRVPLKSKADPPPSCDLREAVEEGSSLAFTLRHISRHGPLPADLDALGGLYAAAAAASPRWCQLGDLATATWAVARLPPLPWRDGPKRDALLARLAQAVLAAVRDGLGHEEPHAVAKLLWSLVAAGADWRDVLADLAACLETEDAASRLEPAALSAAAWALRTADVSPVARAALAEAAVCRLADFRAADLARLATALADSSEHDPFFRALHDRLAAHNLRDAARGDLAALADAFEGRTLEPPSILQAALAKAGPPPPPRAPGEYREVYYNNH